MDLAIAKVILTTISLGLGIFKLIKKNNPSAENNNLTKHIDSNMNTSKIENQSSTDSINCGYNYGSITKKTVFIGKEAPTPNESYQAITDICARISILKFFKRGLSQPQKNIGAEREYGIHKQRLIDSIHKWSSNLSYKTQQILIDTIDRLPKHYLDFDIAMLADAELALGKENHAK